MPELGLSEPGFIFTPAKRRLLIVVAQHLIVMANLDSIREMMKQHPSLVSLRSELNIGLTFANLALSAENPQKRRSFVKNAMAAYAAVRPVMGGIAVNKMQADDLAWNMTVLRQKLAKLGQSVPLP